MVIQDAINLLTQELHNRREAELLMMYVLDTDITGVLLNRSKILSKEQEQILFDALKRRKNGEPVQYITGSCEFMSLEFKVDKNVLIPRSDTETLVEYLIDKIENKSCSVLDIGTGSGCIGISLAKYCKNITVNCVDISEGALGIARENAKCNQVSDSVSFEKLDILTEIPKGEYDVLVSNPPYIRPDVIKTLESEVKDFEPYSALYGGEDGLIFYRRITDIAPIILKTNGILAYEIGYEQGKSVSELLEKNFYDIKVINDLCDNNRVVTGILKS